MRFGRVVIILLLISSTCFAGDFMVDKKKKCSDMAVTLGMIVNSKKYGDVVTVDSKNDLFALEILDYYQPGKAKTKVFPKVEASKTVVTYKTWAQVRTQMVADPSPDAKEIK